jgi:aminoglycoside phosphotransferase (APT) family kinase protein
MLTRTLLRATPDFQLKWIYRSVQFWTEKSFRAWTFLYRRESGKTSVYEFPRDPKLRGLPGYLAAVKHRAEGLQGISDVNVLRYVPRRRFTFRTSHGEKLGAPAESIGKMVRPSETEQVYQRLQALENALGKVSFAVAPVLKLDRVNSLFFQQARPGIDLAGVISERNLESYFQRAGEIHAEIHSLEMPRTQEWEAGSYARRVERDLQWITSFCPQGRALIEAAWRTWRARTPNFDPRDFAFCHGDFRAAHLLVTERERWSVVDFDGCLHADPCWDMAWFLASLKRDVPFIVNASPALLAQAEESYLKGYSSARTYSVERLNWFRVAEEIHFLARSFQRDLLNEDVRDRTLARVQEFAGKLT